MFFSSNSASAELLLSKWFVLKQIEKFCALPISANVKQNCIQLLPQQVLLLGYSCRTGPAERLGVEPGGDCSSTEVRDKALVLTHLTSRYSLSVSLVLDVQKYTQKIHWASGRCLNTPQCISALKAGLREPSLHICLERP